LDIMEQNANKYIEKIEKEYEKIIGSTEGVDKYTYIFKSTNEEIVFTIKFGIIEGEYAHYPLRSYTELPNTTPICSGIFISWLETVPKYQGQGHASKLILYIICLAFIFYKDNPLLFVKLEDATNKYNQRLIKRPFYYTIGFTPTDLIEINISQSNRMKGVDSGRVASMEHLLTAIVPNKLKHMNTQGGSSKRKTRKRKTKKNKRAL